MTKENWGAVLGALVIALLIALFGSHDTYIQQESAYAPLPADFTESETGTSTLVAGVGKSGSATSTKAKEGSKTASTGPSHELALALGSLKKSLVNILCISHKPSLKSISATGVLFDSRGLILTNAHVAQYFLLRDELPAGTITCVVRTGSPATTAYVADLAYISGRWMAANPKTLVTLLPTGTGQDDIAVLAITDSATKTPLPDSFPAVRLSTAVVELKLPVAIGSYGAQTLTSAQIASTLYPTLVFGTVLDRYTFTTTTVDLLSLGGSAVAQEGSSGGGVINESGMLIGLITNSSVEGTFFSRDLRAVTSGHIRRSFAADTGSSFDTYFASKSPTELVKAFQDQAGILAESLVRAIKL